MQTQTPLDQENIVIEQAKAGSQRAYKQLYDSNVVHLYRFLRQYSSNDRDVEEWVQRAFIKAFDSIALFRGGSKFSSWIFRIGINEMRMDKRKTVRETVIDETEPDSNDSQVEDFEWDQQMKQWFEKLDDQKKLVFMLYEIEGYSHAEISEMLQIGESTSRTMLTRVKRYLQECWNKEKHQ